MCLWQSGQYLLYPRKFSISHWVPQLRSQHCERNGGQSWRRRCLWQSWQCLTQAGDFQQAIEYHNQHLRIAKQLRNIDLSIGKELGERTGEGDAYGRLNNCKGPHTISAAKVASTKDLISQKYIYMAIPIKCFVSHRPPSREGGSVGRAKNK